MPGWALNVAVDELLKKEFDLYRKEQKPHPIMIKHKLNFVPYQHKDLDEWRRFWVSLSLLFPFSTKYYTISGG